MANYFKGTLLHAQDQGGTLTWGSTPNPRGNELKRSSVSEIYHTLNNHKMHISIPLTGPEYYRVGGQLHKVDIGQYLVHHPRQLVLAEAQYTQPVDGLCLFLTDETLSDVYRSIQNPFHDPDTTPNRLPWGEYDTVLNKYSLSENELGQHFSRILGRLSDTDHTPIMDWDAFYLEVATPLVNVLFQVQNRLISLPFVKKITKDEIFKRVSLAHGYLLDHFDRPLLLSDLANVACISPYHLLRLYKHIYRVTPYQHILQLRIERARYLLSAQYSTTEIADQLSFSDRRAFSKVFKKITGLSPNAYRSLGTVFQHRSLS